MSRSAWFAAWMQTPMHKRKVPKIPNRVGVKKQQMKKVNIALIFMMSFMYVAPGFSQAFQSTFSKLGLDFNHYSIEKFTTGGGGYICAGTMFDPVSNNNDMHIFMLDPGGNMVWERMMDETFDDRILDLVVDTVHNNGIVITGYITPGAANEPQLYVAQLDLAGNIIADRRLIGFPASVGTNVIYSSVTRTWTVGGFYADPLSGYPITGNEAILVEFDLALNLINQQQFSTPDMDHSSINDIVEIPGTGYFITGGVGVPWGFPVNASQAVLAIKVDYSYNVMADLSFESTNSEHCGVSLVYEASTDHIYLMSNNSIVHCPQITTINNVTGTPAIISHNRLYLDPTYGSHNAAGFQLKKCPWNQSNLVASGYFQNFTDGFTPNNAIMWVTEFEKVSGAEVNTRLWQFPSANFQAHGGGLLSTFSGEHPYIFNQEIMTERLDGDGFVIIAPRTVGGNYGIDIVTTHQAWGMPCYTPYTYATSPTNHVDITTITTNYTPISAAPWNASPKGMLPTSFGVSCPAMIGSSMPVDDDVVERTEERAQYHTAGFDKMTNERADALKVYPNPFNDHFIVEVINENIEGALTITNVAGQVVYSSGNIPKNSGVTRIDATEFDGGIYFVTYLNKEGQSNTQRIVKL